MVEAILAKISTPAIRARLYDFFTGFDRHQIRRITPNQGIRALDQAGAKLTPDEIAQIQAAYTDTEGDFDYLRLIEDVNDHRSHGYFEKNAETDPRLSPTRNASTRPMHISSRAPGSAGQFCPLSEAELEVLDDVLDRVRGEVKSRGLEIRHYMRDYDKVNRGWITFAAFRRQMVSLFPRLSEAEIELLCKAYCNADRTEVRYLVFYADVTEDFVGMPPTAQPQMVPTVSPGSALSKLGHVLGSTHTSRENHPRMTQYPAPLDRVPPQSPGKASPRKTGIITVRSGHTMNGAPPPGALAGVTLPFAAAASALPYSPRAHTPASPGFDGADAFALSGREGGFVTSCPGSPSFTGATLMMSSRGGASATAVLSSRGDMGFTSRPDTTNSARGVTSQSLRTDTMGAHDTQELERQMTTSLTLTTPPPRTNSYLTSSFTCSPRPVSPISSNPGRRPASPHRCHPQYPDLVRIDPAATLRARELDPSDLQSIMASLIRQVYDRRIRLADSFVDYDRTKRGVITRNQFTRGLTLLNLTNFGPRVIDALADHFADRGDVTRATIAYGPLVDEVERAFVEPHLDRDPETVNNIGSFAHTVVSAPSPRKQPNQLPPELAEVFEAAMERVRAIVKRNAITDLRAAFESYQTAKAPKTGMVTEHEFVRTIMQNRCAPGPEDSTYTRSIVEYFRGKGTKHEMVDYYSFLAALGGKQ